MNINELREKRAKAWEATKAFLENQRTEKGTLSAEDDQTYNRMMEDYCAIIGLNQKDLENQGILA